MQLIATVHETDVLKMWFVQCRLFLQMWFVWHYIVVAKHMPLVREKRSCLHLMFVLPLACYVKRYIYMCMWNWSFSNHGCLPLLLEAIHTYRVLRGVVSYRADKMPAIVGNWENTGWHAWHFCNRRKCLDLVGCSSPEPSLQSCPAPACEGFPC